MESPINPEATFENFIIEKRANQESYHFYIFSYKTINLPNCYSPLYPGGGGSAPSVLGEYIKYLPENDEYTTETTTNNAP